MSAHVLLNLFNELRKIDKKNNLGNSFGLEKACVGIQEDLVKEKNDVTSKGR